MKKILITGSRNFTDKKLMFDVIMEHIGLSDNTVVHGGAKGVDSVAEEICNHYSIKTEVIKALQPGNKLYYLYRNTEMIGMCDEVIAIWDGESRGTKFTIDYAEGRNKPITIIKFEPEE